MDCFELGTWLDLFATSLNGYKPTLFEFRQPNREVVVAVVPGYKPTLFEFREVSVIQF